MVDITKKMKNIDAIKKGPLFWKQWISSNEISTDILDFSNADLKGLNLYDLSARDEQSYYIVNLKGANFQNCDLSNAVFDLANLEKSNFENSNLVNASFRKANCFKAIFKNCDLQDCNFHRSILDECDFSFSNLRNARFELSSGENLDLLGAKISDIELTPLMPPYNELLSISHFELALAKNLDKVHPDSQEFVLKYITEAFENIHKKDFDIIEKISIPGNNKVKEYKRKLPLAEKSNLVYFNKLINRISALNNIFIESEFTDEVVKISNILSTELIKYLKSNPTHLYQIHWRIFEELIAEILKSFGWTVDLTSRTKDGGYDIFGIYKDMSGIQHNWLIECKKWDRTNIIGINVVRALYGVKTDLKVGNALLATTSYFSKGVDEFKSSHYDFETVDFNGIVEWLNKYKMKKSGKLWISDNKLIKI